MGDIVITEIDFLSDAAVIKPVPRIKHKSLHITHWF